MVVKYLGSVAILIILLRASCLTLEINEFGCYETKVHIEDCEGGVTNRKFVKICSCKHGCEVSRVSCYHDDIATDNFIACKRTAG